MSELAQQYLETTVKAFDAIRRQGERALAQVADEQLVVALDPGSNSLAVLVKHLAGNMRSRWTDFLTSDGEKPGRQRDREFEGGLSRAEAMAAWRQGWDLALAALRALRPEDLSRTVTIRGKSHTVVQAVSLSLVHYAQHVGQIVFLAKHLAGPGWQSLSVPRAPQPPAEPDDR